MTDLEVGRFALRTFAIHGGRATWINHECYMDGGLRSVRGGAHWDQGVCEAACLIEATSIMSWGGQLIRRVGYETAHPSEPAPKEGCTCGIYGTLSLKHLMEQYPKYASKLVCVFAAEGITLIGKTKGLRTQRARIVAYWTGYREDRIGERAYLRLIERDLPGAKRYPDIFDMLESYGFPDGRPIPVSGYA